MKNICKICSAETSKIFDAMILNKYRTDYFRCNNCFFIQTEEPYWLAEAYISAMTALDVGLIYRNISLSRQIPAILDIFSNQHDSYIDYGGGYGMFVRIMRDLGYDFYLQDKYAENIFAKNFEADNSSKKKFTALTTFEVFEHLVDPVTELSTMFDLSDVVIFSTELQPEFKLDNSSSWWYFNPEIGQHIAFYSKKSLKILSDKFQCNFYSNGFNLHILSKVPLNSNPFSAPKRDTIVVRILNKLLALLKPSKPVYDRPGLLMKDYELYKNILNNHIE